MKVKVYIPYNTMKRVYGIKTINACNEQFKALVNEIDTIITRANAMSIWDDDGKHRIGISCLFSSDSENAFKIINDTFKNVADEIAIYHPQPVPRFW